MKKIFVVYGHYNEKSFNAAIRDTFKETLENNWKLFEIYDFPGAPSPGAPNVGKMWKTADCGKIQRKHGKY